MNNSGNMLEVRHLKKYFNTAAGELHAVEDVTFSIPKGKTLGVVGESGCGKSTLGRMILKMINPTAGQIIFDGKDITRQTKREHKAYCREASMIFQDPFSSLNPRLDVSDLIAEPLRIFKVHKNKDDLNAHIQKLRETVGLAERFAHSYPHELDGGRRQRIGIARALSLNPQMIVCDEPVSALDVSIQAQVLNLLQDQQEEKGLTYVFITHDLSVVKYISDEIMVMYLGCMVEKAPTKDLFANPLHPYTKGLLSAIPIPTVGEKREKVLLRGEITSPVNVPDRCRFCNRCDYAQEICWNKAPALKEISASHYVACHLVEPEEEK